MNRMLHFTAAVLTALVVVAATLCIVFAIIPAETRSAPEAPAYDIPRIAGLTIDGDGGDWADDGFRVDHIAAPDGHVRPVEDFDVRFRLGWNDAGLLALVTVRDDVAWEAPERVWRFDCVELFVADSVGSENFYQVIVNSGADPEFGSLRQRIFDKRPDDMRDPATLAARAASRIAADGYTIEALLPWDNLGIEPGVGVEAAFQLVANDDDGATDTREGAVRQAWYPSTRSHESSTFLHAIRLADAAGAPVRYRVGREIDRTGANISVSGAADLVGTPFLLYTDDIYALKGELEPVGGRAGVTFRINADEDGMIPAMRFHVFEESPTVMDELPSVGRVLDR
jgi:hypothetical protein